MIFNAISGSSGWVPVMLIDGNEMYYTSMGVACIYCTTGANSCSFEKAPQVHNVRHPRVLQLVLFLGISIEALYNLENACYSHRV